MTFLWKEFVDSVVKSPGQFDAGNYGIVVEFVESAVYRCIGVHHLDQAENVGKHNVFICIVDEQGKRIPNAKFQWSRIGSQTIYTVACDKPDNEPWGNFALDGIGVVATVWVAGAVSDRVRGLSTKHADEPPGNTLGHHSFLCVFQRGVATPVPPLPPPVPPLPPPVPPLPPPVPPLPPPVPPAGLEARVAALERRLAAAARVLTS